MLKVILQKFLAVSAVATFTMCLNGAEAWADCEKKCEHHSEDEKKHKHCIKECQSGKDHSGKEESKDRNEGETPHTHEHHTPGHHKHHEEEKTG